MVRPSALGIAALVLSALALPAVAGCDAEDPRIRPTGIRVDPPECLESSDCDDGVECTVPDCIGLRCIQGRPPGLCPGSACVPDLGGCASDHPCREDADCADDDPCTTAERCEAFRCVLTWIGDRDADGDLAPECGGGDCDDGNPDVSSYDREVCDGRDDDCDGDVDEQSCGLGRCVTSVQPSRDGGSARVPACVCGPGEGLCNRRCVNMWSDVEHCGSCGVRCSIGGFCEGGVCVCPAGLEECVELRSCSAPGRTATRCGPCQTRCPDGAACVDGQCVCPGGLTACGAICVDLLSDEASCGACGFRCSCGECVEGRCEVLPPQAICGGRCTNLSYDRYSCGACDRACEGAERCASGECICEAPSVICDGRCTDLTSEGSHCGACGRACASGSCWAGQCACALCEDGGCHDLEFDDRRCGGCDVSCGAGAACLDEVCVPGGGCATRLGGCSGFAQEPFGGGCARIRYEWCSGGEGSDRVVRVEGIADRSLAIAWLGIAGAEGATCSVGASAAADGRPHPMVICADASGRLDLREPSLALDGGAGEGLVLDASWSGSTAALAGLECDADPLGACVARLWEDRWGDARLGGGRSSGEALAWRDGSGQRSALAGTFEGSIGPPCAAFAETCPVTIAGRGGRDAFVVLTSTRLEDSPIVVLGGSGDDAAHGLAALAGGEVIVVGEFEGSLGARGVVSAGGHDAFVARLRADGSVAWARALGGAGEERALRVRARGGDVIVAGTFASAFDAGGGTLATPSGGGVMIVALDLATGAHRWSRALDAEAWDAPLASAGIAWDRLALGARLGLDVDAGGDVLVAASTAGVATLGALSVSSAGGRDLVVARLAPDGTPLGLRAIGGADDEWAGGIARGAGDAVWVAALASGTLVVDGRAIAVEGASDAVTIALRAP